MDNLAQVSRRLHETSTETSKSNLKRFVGLHKKNQDRFHPELSKPGAWSNRVTDGGEVVEISYPRIQGVGSAAFKQLDISVKGPNSLRAYNLQVRRDIDNAIGGPQFGYAVFIREGNVRHADELLKSLV
jgi:hypothetical protein